MYSNDISKLTFSPDGKRLAYRVFDASDEETKGYFVVVDGQEGKIYNHIWDLTFSPNSEKLAYVGHANRRNIIVIDGVEFSDWPEPLLKDLQRRYHTNIAFSPDSEKLAYFAAGRIDYFIVINGQRGRSYDDVYGPIVFSPDGKSVSYGARKGNDILWVVDSV